MEKDERDTTSIISSFNNFFDANYKVELLQALESITIPFISLAKWDPDLADELLEQPEETIKAAEIAAKGIVAEEKELAVRFSGLPKTQQRNVWEVRKEDITKFIALNGIINKLSSIIHLCESARFECPVCGNIINMLQMDANFREPSRCACGRKGKFTLIDKEFTDIIKIGLIDDLMERENVDRNIAREKLAILSGKDLTSAKVDKMIKPGRKVILNGYFKYHQKKPGSTEFDSIFQINSIEFVQVGWDTITVSKSEEEAIKKLAKEDNIISRLAESIADVEGFPEVKIASLLLLAGAPHIYDENGHLSSRGTIHVLMVSDPGAAKTFLLKRAGSISPIFYFQSAATASGRGLIASVVQDKDIGNWAIYPGVVAMASKGVAGLDEIDKTHKDDYGDHNNAMNDMLAVIAKANVKARIETETSYLATANPENRIFTAHESYYNQIDMPKDFLDRFDIILPMIPPIDNKSKDRIMDIMLDRHVEKRDKESWHPEFSHDFIRKYIAYCRQNNPKPKLSKELFVFIKKQLNELMRPKEDEQVRISFRQLESIMRFAYASARLRLRDITQEDINLSFSLKKKSFKDLGILSESGVFDWAKEEQIDEQAISNKDVIRNILREMMPDNNTFAEWQAIIHKCVEKGIKEDVAEEYIQKLITKGDYYEPKRGFLRRI